MTSNWPGRVPNRGNIASLVVEAVYSTIPASRARGVFPVSVTKTLCAPTLAARRKICRATGSSPVCVTVIATSPGFISDAWTVAVCKPE